MAVRGDPASLRYARDGDAYVYLPKGKHVILIGLADRVGEYPVDIRSLENAIPLVVDLEDERALLFAGCPEAVDPYLQGDLETAAGALEAAGNQQATHRVRAALYQRRGELDRAAAEFEAAGELEQAAELRANDAVYDFLIKLMRVERSIGRFYFFASQETVDAIGERFDRYLEEHPITF